jgi:hypothetical protein
MAATHTPHADKIRWHGGSHLNGGVSQLGEYFISDGTIRFKHLDGQWENIDARNGSDMDTYRGCVAHNKRLLGIAA